MTTTTISLPAEIVEQIIQTSWLSFSSTSPRLSNTHRIEFMVSSLLVSKAWSSIFQNISAKNVYIPCRSYATHFQQLLEPQTTQDRGNSSSHPRYDQLCRSLTFYIEPPTVDMLRSKTTNTQVDIGASVFNLLHYIHRIPALLPLLTKISIHYYNSSFGDLFQGCRLINFPPQVTHLEISYQFEDDKRRDRSVEEMRVFEGMWDVPLLRGLKHVRKLSVFGAAGTDVSERLKRVCLGVENVEVDGGESG